MHSFWRFLISLFYVYPNTNNAFRVSMNKSAFIHRLIEKGEKTNYEVIWSKDEIRFERPDGKYYIPGFNEMSIVFSFYAYNNQLIANVEYKMKWIIVAMNYLIRIIILIYLISHIMEGEFAFSALIFALYIFLAGSYNIQFTINISAFENLVQSWFTSDELEAVEFEDA